MSTKAKKKSKFDVSYFISKFQAIPNNKWLMGELREDGKCCALGWCGVKPSPSDDPGDYKFTREALALEDILSTGFGVHSVSGSKDPNNVVTAINDANRYDNLDYFDIVKLGKTPRTRILNALKKVQKLEAKASR